MKKLAILPYSFLMLLAILQVIPYKMHAQESKHVVGIGFGRVAYSDDIVYVSTGSGVWFKYNKDVIFNLNYAYKVYPYFRIGGYFEYESAEMESDLLKNTKGSRFDIGGQWLGEYPKTKLRAQLGGYFAFSVLSNELWDKTLKGINYGIMAGPCYDFGKISISLHVHAGMSPYFGDEPEDVDVLAPKVFLKIYYTL